MDATGALEHVGRVLARRGRSLLALDNLEQLEPGALEAVAALLERAPKLVVVSTSRVVLGLPDEVVHRLLPLAVVGEGSADPPALVLFEERARAVRRPVADSERDLARQVTVHLEGIPLALEMAASRLSLLSLPELLVRLAQPLPVLTTTRGPCAERHATMARAVEDSWKLLTDGDREVLAALLVFPSGFTREAAESIVGTGASAAIDRLLDSSMLHVPTTEGRLAIYELVREYVSAQRRGAALDEVLARRHARWFAAWAADRAHLLGPDGETPRCDAPTPSAALRDLLADEPNLGAGARWASRQADDEAECLRLELLWALTPVRMLRGRLDEHASELEGALGEAPDRSALRIRARLALARSLHELGFITAARSAYERVLAALEDGGTLVEGAAHATLRGTALVGLGRLRSGLGEWEGGLACFSRARGLTGAGERVVRLADACFEFFGGEIGIARREVEAVTAYVVECRKHGDPRELAHWLTQLGRIESELARKRESAEAHFEEALVVARSTGDLRGEGFALFGLGAHLLVVGDRSRSASVLTEAERMLFDAGARRARAWSLGFLGVALTFDGEENRADRVFDEAIYLLQDVADAPREALVRGFRAVLREGVGDLDGARADLDRARSLVPPSSVYHAWTLDLCAAVVDIGAGAGSESARALFERLGCWGDRRPVVPAQAASWPWQKEMYEPRIALELLARAMSRVGGRRSELRITRDGSAVVLPSRERVSCTGRVKVQRVLAVLAQAREAHPGVPVSADALIAAAWSGERIQPSAARNRLHVTLDHVRKLGLRDVVLRSGQGWMLDPAVGFGWLSAED